MDADRFKTLAEHAAVMSAAGDKESAFKAMVQAILGYDQFVLLARTPEGGLAAFVEGDGIWAIGAMEYHQRQMIAWNLKSASDRLREAEKAQFELALAVGAPS